LLAAPGQKRGEGGIVAVNLTLTIAFALFAVIMLTKTTIAAQQIDDRVKIITTEVGPGSNVSRLDETAILNTVADRADQILAAAKPLSGQANEVLVAAKSIDSTVTQINGNAGEINSTVKSINGTLSAAAPVVDEIHQGIIDINNRLDRVLGSVSGIKADTTPILSNVISINSNAGAICGAPPGSGTLLTTCA
jgi:methyl-accepting chemotaxis protein